MGADIRFFVQVKKHFYKEGAYDYYAWDNLPLWTENSEHRKVLADLAMSNPAEFAKLAETAKAAK